MVVENAPTYAVLGATGNCGTALIELILRIPYARIKAYCRDGKKLLQMVPQVADNKRVEIFEGSISDAALIADCIRGTDAVFHTVSSNTNAPGYNTGEVVTRHIIEGLRQPLKADDKPKIPKIVLLSSATIDDHLARSMPGWFRPVMLYAHRNVYNDLRRSEELLRAEESWLTTIFVKPGGLSVDKQRGHALNLEHEESFISYLDLSAGMLEAAHDCEGQYDMRNVAVINTGGSAKLPSGTPMCILTGLLRSLFPFLHPYLPRFGPQ